MSETNKPTRLNKVARELNVGITTLVEFLSTKGIDIEAKPTTKVNTDVYEVLVNQFHADKSAKEKSKLAGLQREERKTVAIETVTIKEEEKTPEPPVVEEPVAVATPEPVKAPEPTPEPEPVVVAPVEKEVVKEEPIVEAKVEEVAPVVAEKAPVVEEKTPVAEEKVEAVVAKTPAVEEQAPVQEEKAVNADGSPIKVLGRIDLSTLNQKTRPDKKNKKQREDEIAVQKKAAKQRQDAENIKREESKKQQEIDAKAKSIADAEAIIKARKDQADKASSEVVRAKAKTLTGPTVVGKIELPVEKKKKPVASSSDNDLSRRKRKRKRINPPGGSNTGGASTGKGIPVKPGQNRGPQDRNKPARSVDPRNKPRGKAGAPATGPKEVDEAAIQREVKETLARLSGGGKSKGAKNRRAKRDMVSSKRDEELERQEAEKSVLKVTEFVTVSELGTMMSVSATEIIGACLSLGIIAAINQRLDAETLVIIAEEFGYSLDFVDADVTDDFATEDGQYEDTEDRSPIVTVMGHVDHGKTSLLDYIRKANVIAGEAGGITQHIGAYGVELDNGKRIAFLDTPGHEAFTAMRARGAKVTDIAIIVVAADDAVMPQTKEAINHAQAAGVPMVFAINKIDKPGANPDKVREELSAMNILVEEWGGKYQCQEISAKKGLGIEELLEKVLLEAELLELKANSERNARGTIIESTMDKGRGYVTTLLVQNGTLSVGDVILAGQHYGKVKAMHNERGTIVQTAGPATPVSILGITGSPNAGDQFHIMNDEREAKAIANKRQQLLREQGVRTQKHITLDEIGRRLAIGDFQELNVIIKGDVDGSVEALSDSLQKLSTEEIQVNVIHKAVGPISESDVLLATASDAIIVGFQVRPTGQARKLAEKEEIDIRLYSIIYKAIDEIKDAMEGMLSPDIKEEIIGTAEIRETFKISKVGTIAGCFMLDGKLNRKSKIRVIRQGIVIYTGELDTLKRFKDDVKEVTRGYEFGLSIAKYNDIQEGDNIEAFEEVEVKKTL
jgi:translation initiation factor IF-2